MGGKRTFAQPEFHASAPSSDVADLAAPVWCNRQRESRVRSVNQSMFISVRAITVSNLRQTVNDHVTVGLKAAQRSAERHPQLSTGVASETSVADRQKVECRRPNQS